MRTLSSEVRGVRPPRRLASIVSALLAGSALVGGSLAGTGAVSLIAIVASTSMANADGGAGGGPGGGAGGVGNSGNPGANGTQPANSEGGGGGGGAAGGGAGGNGGGDPMLAGQGGAGGTALAPNGADGVGGGAGSGGGGGGFNGLATGGNGGNGGSNTGTTTYLTNNTTKNGAGGGGGGGGGSGLGTGGNGGNGGNAGAVEITSTSAVTVQNIAIGGNGGSAGDGGIGNTQSGAGGTGGNGGAGGSGGVGMSSATTTGVGAGFIATGTAYGGAGGNGANGGNGAQPTTSVLSGVSLAGVGGNGGDGGAATGGGSASGSSSTANGYAAGVLGGNGGNGGIGTVQTGSLTITANSYGGTGGLGGAGGAATATAGNTGAGGIAAATAVGGNGGAGGNGGSGLVVTGANVLVTNSASIVAGDARSGGAGGNAQATALSQNGRAVAATTGGNGGNGGIGADGAIFAGSGVTFTNSGSVLAGYGGNGGASGSINSLATSTVLFTAAQSAGNGGDGGAGGIGVQFFQAGATFNNSGTVLGGNGGAGGNQNGGPGPFGGMGGQGAKGGAGVSFQGSGATLVNSGTITGGRGGEGGNSGAQNNAGQAGVGVVFAGTGTIVNTASGTITGGQGAVQGAGGIIPGAIGILGSGLTITNNGSISGGLDGSNLLGRATAVDFTGGVNAIGGSGSINGGIQLDAGSLAPAVAGSTVGPTLNVNGYVSMNAGTTYNIRVNGAANDSITATGVASVLNVNVVAAVTGNALGKHTILTGSAVVGPFASLTTTGNSAFLQAALSYDPTHAYLTFTGNGANGGIDFTPAAQTVNQMNVASALNSGGAANGFTGSLINLLAGFSAAQARAAFTQLDGEAATGAERAAFRFGDQFLNLMLDPFVNGHFGNTGGGGFNGFAPEQQAELPSEITSAYASVFKAPPPANFEQRWTIWNAAFGGSGKTSGDAAIGSNDTRLSTYGLAGGMDYRFSPNTVVGLAAAGGGTNWNLANALGGGRSESAQIGAYARTAIGPAYLAESISYAGHWFDTNRIALGSNLRASFTGESLGARIEGGYRIAVAPNFGITPYAAEQAQAFHSGAYGETDVNNAGFGLNYAAKNATDIRSELGARFDLPTLLAGTPFVLRGRFAWAHDFVDTPSLNASFQTLPLSNFTVSGAKIAHDSGLASFGADWYLNRDWKLLAKFDGEFAKGSDIYAGTVALRYSW